MTRSLFLRAPAKVNLYLAVVGKRPDGYHNLCTLFQRIRLCDEIRITPADGKTSLLAVTGIAVPCDERNLIVRAYRLLRAASPKTPLVSIQLKKNIPVAAGLGGGSSDAGTFLIGMNQGYHLGLSRKTILNLAAQLGADVPFFASGMSNALGLERGDLLEPRALKLKLWFVIVSFPKGLSTKEIYGRYRWLNLRASNLTKAKHDVTILCNYLRRKDLSHVGALLKNDLMPVCFELKPAVKRVLNFMRQLGAVNVSMTGSGPTCYAVFRDRFSADKLAQALRRRFEVSTIVTDSF